MEACIIPLNGYSINEKNRYGIFLRFFFFLPKTDSKASEDNKAKTEVEMKMMMMMIVVMKTLKKLPMMMFLPWAHVLPSLSSLIPVGQAQVK